ncbi:MAG: MmcQ/YjbR family DNA-binding protein [Myxococcota bacterium]
MPSPLTTTATALFTFAMTLPGATEDFPWGERVVKVNKKVFVFLGKVEDTSGGFGLSVKLPTSAESALGYPFAKPTGYGLGKSGWVSATFAPVDQPDLAMLRAWVEESYRAVAPKKLVKQLDATP